MFAPWRSQNPVRKTWVSDYWKIIHSTHRKILGLVEMTFGLVNASFSLPEWQAVKMTFFAPWALKRDQLNKTNTILIS